jgi:gamma-tubulin complex component 2
MLLAGKYLNVIQECGIEIGKDSMQLGDEELSMEDDRYSAILLHVRLHSDNMQIL